MARFYVYLLMLGVFAVSCRHGKEYVPHVPPPPDFPAPFSVKPAAVQLAESYWNGTLRERYIYKNGQLAEQHSIIITSSLSEQIYGKSYYDRQEGMISSLVYWSSPDIVGYEGGNIGPLTLQHSFTFQTPQSDTLREAVLSGPNRVALVKYGMNAKGHLTSVEGLSVGSKTLFERNAQNNVSRIQYYYPHDPEPTIVTNEYDDHPNPFFAMGRMGELAIDTSPNNVIRSVTQYVFDNEPRFTTTTYEYTYRPNGYPEKVVVKNDSGTLNNTVIYKYNE